MARFGVIHDRLVRERKLGPAARLLPTTAAITLRKDRDPPLVLDGPFAETKEQLLGFYIVDCARWTRCWRSPENSPRPIHAAPTRFGPSACCSPGGR